MESLILALLNDPFGVSKANIKTLLQIYEDETGEEDADALEDQISETTIDGHKRYRIT